MLIIMTIFVILLSICCFVLGFLLIKHYKRAEININELINVYNAVVQTIEKLNKYDESGVFKNSDDIGFLWKDLHNTSNSLELYLRNTIEDLDSI